jgi:hypothetical protein
MHSNDSAIIRAKELIEEHGKKAVNTAKRRVESLSGQHSRESDFAFMVLNEVEKLVKDLD